MTDIFFRRDNFKDEPWYGELQMFCNIGICKPERHEYVEPMWKALTQLGYGTRILNKDGQYYLIGN